MEPLISVIIPVYKVEQYLEKCLRSVTAQSYKNLEIILVDDGSPDRCGSICDSFAEKDSRIKVIHKENGGLSDARNAGSAAAKGEYISFIDSDDYVSEDYIRYMYDLLTESGAELSCCLLQRTELDDFVFPDSAAGTELLSGREACKALTKPAEYSDFVTAPCKLIKRELVLRYPFPKGRKHEDEATVYKYFFSCSLVVLGRKVLYAYRYNPGSITNTAAGIKNEAAITAFSERAEFFRAQGDRELSVLFTGEYLRYLLMLCGFGNGCCRKELSAAFKKGLRQRLVSFKVFVWVCIYYLSPALYRRLYAKSSPDARILKEV